MGKGSERKEDQIINRREHLPKAGLFSGGLPTGSSRGGPKVERIEARLDWPLSHGGETTCQLIVVARQRVGLQRAESRSAE